MYNTVYWYATAIYPICGVACVQYIYRIWNLFNKSTENQEQGKTSKLFLEYPSVTKQRHLSGKSMNFLQFWIKKNRSESRDTIQSRR
jgi:hypothetical protein